jgi:hypothetical protein
MKYLAIVGVAALVTACDSLTSPHTGFVTVSPHAANAVVSNDRFEKETFAPDYWCGSAGLTLQATWHHVFGINFDGAGGVHVKDHYNVQGQGSDLTGIDYVLADVGNYEFDGKLGFEETNTESYNVIAKGNAPNLTVLIDDHITLTPNGDVTSYHSNFRVKCQ